MLNLPAAELRIEATRSGMPHVKGQGTAATTLLHKHQVTSGYLVHCVWYSCRHYASLTLQCSVSVFIWDLAYTTLPCRGWSDWIAPGGARWLCA